MTGGTPLPHTRLLLRHASRAELEVVVTEAHGVGLDSLALSIEASLPLQVAALRWTSRERPSDGGRTWLALGFEGRTEREVAGDLARLLQEHGHERADFTIVGSGPNAASSHHEAGDRRIALGDAVVMDFGGVMNHYCSDLTRTIFLGTPDEQFMRVYDTVLIAQLMAEERIEAGMTGQQAHEIAATVIREAGYGEYFIHRTGHGIGLTTHEPPYLVEGEEQELVPGTAARVHPFPVRCGPCRGGTRRCLFRPPAN